MADRVGERAVIAGVLDPPASPSQTAHFLTPLGLHAIKPTASWPARSSYRPRPTLTLPHRVFRVNRGACTSGGGFHHGLLLAVG